MSPLGAWTLAILVGWIATELLWGLTHLEGEDDRWK